MSKSCAVSGEISAERTLCVGRIANGSSTLVEHTPGVALYSDVRLDEATTTSDWNLAPKPCCPRLYGSPRIRRGEVLSGWLRRVAGSQRFPISTVLQLLKWPRSSDRMDFNRAGPDPQRLAGLTLNEVADVRGAQDLGRTLLGDPAFLGLSVDLRDMTPIYRYCAACLRDDAVAFIRASWRTAYTFVCATHRAALRDCCPHCSVRVDHSASGVCTRELGAANDAIRCCRGCGGDVAMTGDRKIDDRLFDIALARQQFCHRMVLAGVLRHPRLGTISATGIVASYLTAVGMADEDRSASAGMLDFHRLFTIWAPALAEWLSLGLRIHYERPTYPRSRSE